MEINKKYNLEERTAKFDTVFDAKRTEIILIVQI